MSTGGEILGVFPGWVWLGAEWEGPGRGMCRLPSFHMKSHLSASRYSCRETIPPPAMAGAGRLPPRAMAGAGRLPPPAMAGAGRVPPRAMAGAGRLPPHAMAGAGRLPPRAMAGAGRLPPRAMAGAGRLPPTFCVVTFSEQPS